MMKKSLYATGIAILIALQAFAQSSETMLLAKLPMDNHLDAIASEAVVRDFVAPAAVELKFRNDFVGTGDAEWMETNNGYRVYFMKDAFLTAADYTRKGKLYSTIRYGNNLLSKSQKNQLNYSFDEYEIRQVSEVKMAGSATMVYVVIVDDKVSVKTVQLMDGDLQVIQEQLK